MERAFAAVAFVIVHVGCGGERAAPAPVPAAPAPVVAEPSIDEEPPASDDAVAEVPPGAEVPPETSGPVDLGEARRLARAGRHAEAVVVLDRLLGERGEDARALAARGYSRLFVEPLDESRARGDLERALSLASGDPTLEGMIEFNLGLLEERAGHGFAAREHFARSNELRPTRAAAQRASAECVVDVHVERAGEADALIIARSWPAVAAAYTRALGDDAPSSLPRDVSSLCLGESCSLEAGGAIGLEDEAGLAYGGALVTLRDGRARVVAPLADGERNYRCSAELDGAMVPGGRWTHVRVSAASTGVDEDHACRYARLTYGHALVEPSTGRAIVVRVEQSVSSTTRPPEPVTVTQSATAVRVTGCAMDRTLALAD